MTKKILTALVCAAIILSTTACSSDPAGPEGNTDHTQTDAKQESVPEETRVTNKDAAIGEYIGKYTGDWKNNAPNGNGTFTAEGQVTMSGEWVDGVLNGQGTVEWTDGTVYSGNFVNSKLNGKGSRKYTKDDGTAVTIDGTFSSNSFSSGTTVFRYTDGTILEMIGDWNSDGYFISGTYTKKYTDGSVFVFEGELNDSELYDGIYEIYDSSGSLSDSGTYTRGKAVSDFNKAVGELAQSIGDSIKEDHPWLSAGIKFIGGIIGG